MRQHRIALEGLGLSVCVWTGLVGVALVHHGTNWPHALPADPARNLPAASSFEAWENFVTVALIVEATFLAAWAVYRRARPRDGLVWALIGFFAAFAVLFLWAMAAQLFSWQTTDWIRRLVLRYPLLVSLLVFIGQLMLLDDEGSPRRYTRQRASVEGG